MTRGRGPLEKHTAAVFGRAVEFNVSKSNMKSFVGAFDSVEGWSVRELGSADGMGTP